MSAAGLGCCCYWRRPLQWHHNERDGVSNHRHLQCLPNCWFRRWSKKTSKLRVTGLCAGNSPVTGEFPAQMARNAENVSIWWRHHGQQAQWWPSMHRSAHTREHIRVSWRLGSMCWGMPIIETGTLTEQNVLYIYIYMYVKWCRYDVTSKSSSITGGNIPNAMEISSPFMDYRYFGAESLPRSFFLSFERTRAISRVAFTRNLLNSRWYR